MFLLIGKVVCLELLCYMITLIVLCDHFSAYAGWLTDRCFAYLFVFVQNVYLLGWQQPATWPKSSKYSPCRALSFCTLVLIYSHQTHNRLYIFVCPVTPWIAAWSPWWILYRLWRNLSIYELCVMWSHFSDDKFLCQKVGLRSPTQAPL